MKYPLILAVLVAGIIAASFDNAPQKRYFYVAFDCQSLRGSSTVETITMLNYAEAVRGIRADAPEIPKSDSIVITGIYEFKTKTEMTSFYKR